MKAHIFALAAFVSACTSASDQWVVVPPQPVLPTQPPSYMRYYEAPPLYAPPPSPRETTTICSHAGSMLVCNSF